MPQIQPIVLPDEPGLAQFFATASEPVAPAFRRAISRPLPVPEGRMPDSIIGVMGRQIRETGWKWCLAPEAGGLYKVQAWRENPTPVRREKPEHNFMAVAPSSEKAMYSIWWHLVGQYSIQKAEI